MHRQYWVVYSEIWADAQALLGCVVHRKLVTGTSMSIKPNIFYKATDERVLLWKLLDDKCPTAKSKKSRRLILTKGRPFYVCRHTPLIITLGRQRQEALIYITSSRTAKGYTVETLSQKQNKKRRKDRLQTGNLLSESKHKTGPPGSEYAMSQKTRLTLPQPLEGGSFS